jgi:hypothetical protein
MFTMRPLFMPVAGDMHSPVVPRATPAQEGSSATAIATAASACCPELHPQRAVAALSQNKKRAVAALKRAGAYISKISVPYLVSLFGFHI